MPSYLAVLTQDPISEEYKLCNVFANTQQDAIEHLIASNPDWTVTHIGHIHEGSRPESDYPSNSGEGVRTECYELPVKSGERELDVVNLIERFRTIINRWQNKIELSSSRSATGEPSERYKYVAQLIGELNSELSNLPDFWNQPEKISESLL
ncbi:MAG: hypothetical protein JOZ78_09005 [Chroococcidiopsidaceae cyanobacterium CP_BM_ER_R8_30]|nr:hypothetical protein [Chroococcidiopsidaceae cyanobacterium CP_BM_ER_R8_30]